MKYLILFIIFMVTCYALTSTIYNNYYKRYRTVFGKSDVRNYIRFFLEDKSYYQDVIHYPLIKSILILNNLTGIHYKTILTFLIPCLLWVFLPAIMLMFSYKITLNINESVLSTFFLMFSTFFVFFFGVSAIWSQSISFIFYLTSLIFLIQYLEERKGKIPFLFFSIISMLFHPITIVIYVLLFFSLVYDVKDYKKIIIGIILILFSLFIISYKLDLKLLTRYGGGYGEPTYYISFFLYISPYILLLAFISLIKKNYNIYLYYPLFEFRTFSILLLILGYISRLNRSLIYVLPFICIYATLTYKKYINNKYILLFLILTSFLFFNYLYVQFGLHMIEEFSYYCSEEPRLMNPEYLKNLLKIGVE